MSEGFPGTGKKRILLWTLWVLYVGAWSTALLTPDPVKMAEAVLPAPTRFVSAKTLHVAAYLVLTVLTGLLGTRRSWRWALLALLSAHALATEYFQQFVPTREGSWRDVGLDHIGICLGLLLGWKWWFARSPGTREDASQPGAMMETQEEAVP